MTYDDSVAKLARSSFSPKKFSNTVHGS